MFEPDKFPRRPSVCGFAEESLQRVCIEILALCINVFSRNEEDKKCAHIANVYIGNESVIIAPCFNHGALSAEIPDEAVKISRVDESILGEVLKSKLDQSCHKGPTDYSKSTKKDWPAYAISGMKTAKEFEKQYTRYCVRGLNESNLVYMIRSPRLRNGIELQLTFNAIDMPFQVGIKLMKIHDFYQQCSQHA